MTYTRHGHHIKNSPTDDEAESVSVARCGGPRLCQRCSIDAAEWANREEPQVVMELPCFLPGTARDWTEVRAKATITKSGEIHIKMFESQDSVRLVEMARDNILFQVSFDYKMPPEVIGKINNRYQPPQGD